MTEKHCCGTCKFWSPNRNIIDDATFCDWPQPSLPFWASVDNGDHGDYTEYDQGQKCRTWELKVQHERHPST